MIATFKVKKESVDKMAAFTNIVGALNTISGVDDDALWVLQDDALTVYVNGSSARGRATNASYSVDITDASYDSAMFYWLLPLDKFSNAIHKLACDEVEVKVDATSGYVVSCTDVSDRKNANKTVAVHNITSAEAEERINETDKLIDGRVHLQTINVGEALIKSLTSVSALTKLSTKNDYVGLSKNAVRSADTVAVASNMFDDDILVAETDITISNKAIDLLKMLSRIEDYTIRMYEDGPAIVYYVNMPSCSIRVLWTDMPATYEFPTDDELAAVVPELTDHIKVDVKHKDFEIAMNKFAGMFNSTSWKWQQVWFEWDPANKTQLYLHYDDMTGSVECNMPVTLVSEAGPSSVTKFDFFVPTNYLTMMIMKVGAKSDFSLTASSLGPRDPHGIGIGIEAGSTKGIICKLMK